MTVRTFHRALVNAIARRTGLTGKPAAGRQLRRRSPCAGNPGPRVNAIAASAATARHDPSRRRVLKGWQSRVEGWLGAFRP